MLETVDELPERVRMFGQDRAPARGGKSRVVSMAAPHSTMRDMIEDADRNLRTVVKEIRQAAKTGDEHDDASTDVFTRIVQIHEKYQW